MAAASPNPGGDASAAAALLDGALLERLSLHSDLFRVRVGLQTAAEEAQPIALGSAAKGSTCASQPDEDTVALVRAH